MVGRNKPEVTAAFRDVEVENRCSRSVGDGTRMLSLAAWVMFKVVVLFFRTRAARPYVTRANI